MSSDDPYATRPHPSGPTAPPSDTVSQPTSMAETATGPPVPEPPPADVDLRPYSVVTLLGAGGMGEVYRADDPKVRRAVAIKRMKPALAAVPGARDRFLQEARAMGAVAHDNVVPIFHVGEDPAGVPYIVMPLLDGETLDERLKREGSLSLPELLAVGRGIAAGLAAAHARGLIHRDIKPSNVWLEPTADGGFRVKLLDFGLARAADRSGGLTDPGAVVGTPAYMSPEQADGRPVDFRTDLFSLGVLLYHAATGTSPFRRDGTTATLNAVGNFEPPVASDVNANVPRVIAAAVRQLMAKAPDCRPGSAMEVLGTFLQIERDSSAWTEVDRVAESAFRVHARRGRWAGIASAVLGGLAKTARAAGKTLQANGVATSILLLLVVAGAAMFFAWPYLVRNQRPISISNLDIRLTEHESPTISRSNPARAITDGDVVRTFLTLDRPGYVYFLWVNGDGTVDRDAPWERRDGVWVRGPERPENRAARLFTLRAVRPPYETVIILVRATPLPDDADLPTRVRLDIPGGPAGPEEAPWVLTTINGQAVAGDSDRGAVSSAPTDRVRPILDLCRGLREHGICDAFATYSFATRAAR